MKKESRHHFFNRGQAVFWFLLTLVFALPFLRIREVFFDGREFTEQFIKKKQEEYVPERNKDTAINKIDLQRMSWEWRDFEGEFKKIEFQYKSDYLAKSTANRKRSTDYSSLYEHDRVLISDLISQMKRGIKNEKLNYLEAIEYVCSSIQYIPYTLVLPSNSLGCPCTMSGEAFSASCKVQANGRGCCNNVDPFGVYAPFEFVYKKTGDCDTRSLLAFTLLKEMGFDVAVMVSESQRHSVLGVYLPNKSAFSSSDNIHGKKYVLWELTSPFWRLGMQVEGNDWKVALE
jgi:hypothetical protein